MFKNRIILEDGDMSQPVIRSRSVDLRGVSTFKIIVYWEDVSGSPIGELKLNGSKNGKDFDTILESEQSITDSDGNFHIWDFPYNPFSIVRALYTRTQGSGTMTMQIQVGG